MWWKKRRKGRKKKKKQKIDASLQIKSWRRVEKVTVYGQIAHLVYCHRRCPKVATAWWRCLIDTHCHLCRQKQALRLSWHHRTRTYRYLFVLQYCTPSVVVVLDHWFWLQPRSKHFFPHRPPLFRVCVCVYWLVKFQRRTTPNLLPLPRTTTHCPRKHGNWTRAWLLCVLNWRVRPWGWCWSGGGVG